MSVFESNDSKRKRINKYSLEFTCKPENYSQKFSSAKFCKSYIWCKQNETTRTVLHFHIRFLIVTIFFIRHVFSLTIQTCDKTLFFTAVYFIIFNDLSRMRHLKSYYYNYYYCQINLRLHVVRRFFVVVQRSVLWQNVTFRENDSVHKTPLFAKKKK